MSRLVFPPLPPHVAALLVATGLASAAGPVRAQQPAPPAVNAAEPVAPVPPVTAEVTRPPLLRGPHPFHKENTLYASGGYGVANQFHGVHLGIGYGYELVGSLWFDLRLDLVDASGGPPMPPTRCMGCAEVETFASVLGGLSYRLRAQIPVIPYASVTAGPLYLFNRGARGAVGMALRASVGARYYLYEWLGLGLELGGLAGGAVVDDSTGIDAGVALFDLGLGAEIQF